MDIVINSIVPGDSVSNSLTLYRGTENFQLKSTADDIRKHYYEKYLALKKVDKIKSAFLEISSSLWDSEEFSLSVRQNLVFPSKSAWLNRLDKKNIFTISKPNYIKLDGTVKIMSWCPNVSSSHEILAVLVSSKNECLQSDINLNVNNDIIHIMNCSDINERNFKPKILFSFVHDWGSITSMQWVSPDEPNVVKSEYTQAILSKNSDKSQPLYGHMLFCCSDGFMRICPIPRFTSTYQDENRIKVMSFNPDNVLKLGMGHDYSNDNRSLFGYPKCASWISSFPKWIVAGYSTGHIGIFDLTCVDLFHYDFLHHHLSPVHKRRLSYYPVISIAMSPNSCEIFNYTVDSGDSSQCNFIYKFTERTLPMDIIQSSTIVNSCIWPTRADLLVSVPASNDRVNITSIISKRTVSVAINGIRDVVSSDKDNSLIVATEDGLLTRISLSQPSVIRQLMTNDDSDESIDTQTVQHYHYLKMKDDLNRTRETFVNSATLNEVKNLYSKGSIRYPLVNTVSINPNIGVSGLTAVGFDCGTVHLLRLFPDSTSFDSIGLCRTPVPGIKVVAPIEHYSTKPVKKNVRLTSFSPPDKHKREKLNTAKVKKHKTRDPLDKILFPKDGISTSKMSKVRYVKSNPRQKLSDLYDWSTYSDGGDEYDNASDATEPAICLDDDWTAIIDTKKVVDKEHSDSSLKVKVVDEEVKKIHGNENVRLSECQTSKNQVEDLSMRVDSGKIQIILDASDLSVDYNDDYTERNEPNTGVDSVVMMSSNIFERFSDEMAGECDSEATDMANDHIEILNNDVPDEVKWNGESKLTTSNKDVVEANVPMEEKRHDEEGFVDKHAMLHEDKSNVDNAGSVEMEIITTSTLPVCNNGDIGDIINNTVRNYSDSVALATSEVTNATIGANTDIKRIIEVDITNEVSSERNNIEQVPMKLTEEYIVDDSSSIGLSDLVKCKDGGYVCKPTKKDSVKDLIEESNDRGNSREQMVYSNSERVAKNRISSNVIYERMVIKELMIYDSDGSADLERLSVDTNVRNIATDELSMDTEAENVDTKELLIDDNVEKADTKELSIDSNIRNIATNELSMDTEAENVDTKELLIDNTVEKAATKELSIDSNIRNIATNELSMDIDVEKADTDEISIDTNVRNIATNELSMSTEAENEAREELSIDSNIRNIATNELSMDTNVEKSGTDEISIDANVKKAATEELSIDFNTQNIAKNKLSMDTEAEKAAKDELSIDSGIEKTATEELSIDTNFQNISTDERSMDTNVEKADADEILIDTKIGEEVTEGLSIDTNIRTIAKDELSMDTEAEKEDTEKLSIDSYIRNIATNELSIDTNVKKAAADEVLIYTKVGNEATEGLSIDTNIKKAAIEELSMDTDVEKEAAEGLSIDSNIQNITKDELSMDTNVEKEATKGLSIDSNIRNIATDELSIDTDVEKEATEGLSVDTNIQTISTDEILIDTNVIKVVTEGLSIDTNVIKVVTEGLSIDSNVQNIAANELLIDINVDNAAIEDISINATDMSIKEQVSKVEELMAIEKSVCSNNITTEAIDSVDGTKSINMVDIKPSEDGGLETKELLIANPYRENNSRSTSIYEQYESDETEKVVDNDSKCVPEVEMIATNVQEDMTIIQESGQDESGIIDCGLTEQPGGIPEKEDRENVSTLQINTEIHQMSNRKHRRNSKNNNRKKTKSGSKKSGDDGSVCHNDGEERGHNTIDVSIKNGEINSSKVDVNTILVTELTQEQITLPCDGTESLGNSAMPSRRKSLRSASIDSSENLLDSADIKKIERNKKEKQSDIFHKEIILNRRKSLRSTHNDNPESMVDTPHSKSKTSHTNTDSLTVGVAEDSLGNLTSKNRMLEENVTENRRKSLLHPKPHCSAESPSVVNLNKETIESDKNDRNKAPLAVDVEDNVITNRRKSLRTTPNAEVNQNNETIESNKNNRNKDPLAVDVEGTVFEDNVIVNRRKSLRTTPGESLEGPGEVNQHVIGPVYKRKRSLRSSTSSQISGSKCDDQMSIEVPNNGDNISVTNRRKTLRSSPLDSGKGNVDSCQINVNNQVANSEQVPHADTEKPLPMETVCIIKRETIIGDIVAAKVSTTTGLRPRTSLRAPKTEKFIIGDRREKRKMDKPIEKVDIGEQNKIKIESTTRKSGRLSFGFMKKSCLANVNKCHVLLHGHDAFVGQMNKDNNVNMNVPPKKRTRQNSQTNEVVDEGINEKLVDSVSEKTSKTLKRLHREEEEDTVNNRLPLKKRGRPSQNSEDVATTSDRSNKKPLKRQHDEEGCEPVAPPLLDCDLPPKKRGRQLLATSEADTGSVASHERRRSLRQSQASTHEQAEEMQEKKKSLRGSEVGHSVDGEGDVTRDKRHPSVSNDSAVSSTKDGKSSSRSSRLLSGAESWHAHNFLIEWQVEGRYKGGQQTVSGRLFDVRPVEGEMAQVRWSKPTSHKKYAAKVLEQLL